MLVRQTRISIKAHYAGSLLCPTTTSAPPLSRQSLCVSQGVGNRASVEINPSHEVVGFLTCIPKEDVTPQPSLNTLILIPACAFCAFDYN
ncbi:hypothetical protein K443DRAFT_429226 [Laccaria amethystina LaAM-08-1]|uniref:Uncharacterized protein n=1 Tax=Laccaria amethystina LaAM-08-1 TaxID=1095629 RepID=A0A0C9X4N3_9AGAR|nr:hypothetical protein K443DRAFT_429226 [Laccaria amethystina LaAM-08-1]